MANFMTGFMRGYDFVDEEKDETAQEARALEDRQLAKEDRQRRLTREDTLWNQRQEAIDEQKQLRGLQGASYLLDSPDFLKNAMSGNEQTLSALNEYASKDPRIQSFVGMLENPENMPQVEQDIATLESGFKGGAKKSDVIDAANRVLQPFLNYGTGGENKRLVDLYPSKSGKGFYAELEMDVPSPKNGQMLMAGENVSGLVKKGNIDLTKRPKVRMDDGKIATVRTITITDDNGQAILIPTIGPNGEDWTPDQAVNNFKKTGQHLGMFASETEANKYAEDLHKQQEQMYVKKRAPLTPNRSAEDTELKEIPAVELAQSLMLLKQYINSQRVALGDTSPIAARADQAKQSREHVYKTAEQLNEHELEMDKMVKEYGLKEQLEKLKVRTGTSKNAPADQQLTEYLVSTGIYPDRKAAWAAVRKSKSDPVKIAADIAMKEIKAQNDALIGPGDDGYRSPDEIRRDALTGVVEMYQTYYSMDNGEKKPPAANDDPLNLFQ